MARRPDREHGVEAFEEIESLVERSARWVAEHPTPVLVALAVLLAGTALFAGARGWGERGERRASEAVAEAREGFLRAMGAEPGAVSFSEPANAETARRAREEYAARFAEAATAHPGTAAAVEGWLEAGNLRNELGQGDAAIEAWERAVAEAPAGSALRGLALERLARGREAKGDFTGAAAAFEEAANAADFPLRHYAMADAARAYVLAGERQRAVALAERLDAEAPELRLPEHVKARLAELRAR
jgi:tetratricopeptide (TPR) repeat protein